ncbi:hypothetical protein OQX63_03165 [Pedobacter sp. PF22-3]|uniref:hypothetical protein n=1 Tax=Pedobacter sp. PF22-3 TaxID=2994467 RepID=UPI0022473F59|nr:hypothetical protein [Pedobacter sp. PF22-3]MCX2492454.1 hypothetical protein [Pedobacter sp. PF22-3]
MKRSAMTQNTETNKKYINTFVATLVIFFSRGCFDLLLVLVARVFAISAKVIKEMENEATMTAFIAPILIFSKYT